MDWSELAEEVDKACERTMALVGSFDSKRDWEEIHLALLDWDNVSRRLDTAIDNDQDLPTIVKQAALLWKEARQNLIKAVYGLEATDN